MKFKIPPPSSGGIILSYQCSNRCLHCLYASSPTWKEWISEEDAERIFFELKKHGRYLTGIHIAGGEPMLRPDLAVSVVKTAMRLGIPLDYIETNAFWCWDDEKTTETFQKLKEAGLPAVLISASPFHAEFVPMERVNRAVRIGRKVFGNRGILIFTNYFYQQLQNIETKHPLPFEDYIEAIGSERASLAFATEYSLIPNGRAATQLVDLYQRRPAVQFFGETCENELSSPHHIHIDLYGNYIAGLCAGISLGDAKNLDALISGIDLSHKPVLRNLVEAGVEGLFQWAVEEYGYIEDVMGYMAKCHLCLDIRRHLIATGTHFSELVPKPFYENLNE